MKNCSSDFCLCVPWGSVFDSITFFFNAWRKKKKKSTMLLINFADKKCCENSE